MTPGMAAIVSIATRRGSGVRHPPTVMQVTPHTE
jgi:hypothetical protein